MFKNILLILSLLTTNLAYALPSSEELFFENIRKETISILQADNISKNDKIVRISKLITKNIASLQVGRSVIGQPWRKLTKFQKREYINTFEVWVGNILAKRLIVFNLKNGLKITRVYRGSNGLVVISTITKHNKSNSDFVIDWYVRQIKGTPKIIDVVVANVSMISTQRAEFTAIYSIEGIKGLINRMNLQINN